MTTSEQIATVLGDAFSELQDYVDLLDPAAAEDVLGLLDGLGTQLSAHAGVTALVTTVAHVIEAMRQAAEEAQDVRAVRLAWLRDAVIRIRDWFVTYTARRAR